LFIFHVAECVVSDVATIFGLLHPESMPADDYDMLANAEVCVCAELLEGGCTRAVARCQYLPHNVEVSCACTHSPRGVFCDILLLLLLGNALCIIP
jgi:hypothetical protein